MNIACIIPAAGTGSRLGSEIPKQFLKINDMMIIEYAIRSLIDGILKSGSYTVSLIIACDSLWMSELQNIALRYVTESALHIVEGGSERKDSINNALQSPLARKSEKLFIHDAARPFIPQDIIASLIDSAHDYPCVIPVLPVSDTLKKVNEHIVVETVDRTQFALAQTPQMIDTQSYLTALQHVDNQIFTDDSSIMEHAGFPIHCIRGHEMMRKITYPYDLIIAELHAYMYEQMSGV